MGISQSRHSRRMVPITRRRSHSSRLPTAARSNLKRQLPSRSRTPSIPPGGAKFVLVTRKKAWGEDRVMYFDAKGKLRSMLASWTSLAEQDLFAQTAAALVVSGR